MSAVCHAPHCSPHSLRPLAVFACCKLSCLVAALKKKGWAYSADVGVAISLLQLNYSLQLFDDCERKERLTMQKIPLCWCNKYYLTLHIVVHTSRCMPCRVYCSASCYASVTYAALSSEAAWQLPPYTCTLNNLSCAYPTLYAVQGTLGEERGAVSERVKPTTNAKKYFAESF